MSTRKSKGLTQDEVRAEIKGKCFIERAIIGLENIDDSGKKQVRLSDYYKCSSAIDTIYLMKASFSKSEILERLATKSIVTNFNLQLR